MNSLSLDPQPWSLLYLGLGVVYSLGLTGKWGLGPVTHWVGLDIGSLWAAALPASCFPDSSEEWKILNIIFFFTMFTNRDILSSVLSLIRILHCWSHQPLETALCLQKSPFRRVYDRWKQTWALSLFIFLPQWERLTLTFLSCLCLQIFIYPVNLSKRQGRLALEVGRLVFETFFWHLLTMRP